MIHTRIMVFIELRMLQKLYKNNIFEPIFSGIIHVITLDEILNCFDSKYMFK